MTQRARRNPWLEKAVGEQGLAFQPRSGLKVPAGPRNPPVSSAAPFDPVSPHPPSKGVDGEARKREESVFN